VSAGGTGPQPAFYTFQAPGGEGTAGQRVIALTFDDGPGPYTPQVLSVLQSYRVPATFFEIGQNMVQYPQYTRMLTAAGYPVENHTWSHPDLTTIPISQFPYQIDQTQNEIRSLTGQTPTCVRPPYDSFNGTVLDQIAQRGLTAMSYSVDPQDWALPGTATIVNRAVVDAFPGAVVDLHDGGGDRSQTVAALPQIITSLKAQGYGFVSICGAVSAPTHEQSAVYSFGDAPTSGTAVISNRPLVGAASSPTGGGYWLVAADGGVFSFSGAGFFGSTGAMRLNQPIVGMAATPTGRGYWLVGADGGVFSFGDARFFGSTGAMRLNQPIVGMAATPAGGGYWLVAADGGIFSFGNIRFFGSTGGMRLNQPIVGMAATPAAGGYWLVAADGGVFTFGDAGFYGSRAGQSTVDRFYAIARSVSGHGYLLAGEHPSA
jgi:peptidoglycan/xylan/chitin deacetylase (PgdA/CDA1 family)